MNWSKHHGIAEHLAASAESLRRLGSPDDATRLYAEAAEAEERAIELIQGNKPRTLGITAVSAAALWYKAGRLEKAEQVAHRWLPGGRLPEFAVEQLRELLQAVWAEESRREAGRAFASGQVVFRISGGDVLRGAAPLDLILEKATTVQSMIFRTVEWLKGRPHRKHGGPPPDIRESCRPWLCHAPPASYQFAVALQEPAQQEMFEAAKPTTAQVVTRFLEIIRASVESPETALLSLVHDVEYRATFLKLVRNLVPSGREFSRLEIRSEDARTDITIVPGVRQTIREALEKQQRDTNNAETGKGQVVELRGVLRAVSLEADWLELVSGESHTRVESVGDTVDDVIGPMVNRSVVVRALRDGPKHLFRDIEPDE